MSHAYYAVWDSVGEEWIGICPDQPFLSWGDPSAAQALEGIKKLMKDIEDGII